MSNKFRSAKLALAVGIALGSSPIYAADGDSAQAKDKDVEKIVVVGSRSAPRSIADSAVPVDIITGEEFAKKWLAGYAIYAAKTLFLLLT